MNIYDVAREQRADEVRDDLLAVAYHLSYVKSKRVKAALRKLEAILAETLEELSDGDRAN